MADIYGLRDDSFQKHSFNTESAKYFRLFEKNEYFFASNPFIQLMFITIIKKSGNIIIDRYTHAQKL